MPLISLPKGIGFDSLSPPNWERAGGEGSLDLNVSSAGLNHPITEPNQSNKAKTKMTAVHLEHHPILKI
jgi:hypothetical protein